MARFVVEGGTPLRGEITPAGNKNEALPLIAASLLTDEPVTLHNVPRIRDVRGMLEIATELGATVEEMRPSTKRHSQNAILSMGPAKRRIWHAREPCLIDAIDGEEP